MFGVKAFGASRVQVFRGLGLGGGVGIVNSGFGDLDVVETRIRFRCSGVALGAA